MPADINTLIQRLSHRDCRFRSNIAQQLVELGADAEPAYDTIVAMLEGKHPDNFYDWHELTFVLKNVDTAKKRPAPPRTRAALVHAMKELSTWIKLKDLVHEISTLGSYILPAVLDALPGNPYYYLTVLFVMGPDAIPALPVLLEYSRSQGKNRLQGLACLTMLGIYTPEVESAFRQAFAEIPDPENLINGVGRMGPLAGNLVPLLHHYLKDANPGGIASTETISEMRFRLRISTERKTAAARSLASMGPRARIAVPELMTCARSSDKDLRQAAMNAFALMGVEARSAVPLLEALGKRERFPEVLASLRSTLNLLKWTAPIGRSAGSPVELGEFIDAKPDPEALKLALQRCPDLISENHDTRVFAARDLLSFIGQQKPFADAIVPAVVKALESPIWENDRWPLPIEILHELGPHAVGAAPAVLRWLAQNPQTDKFWILRDLQFNCQEVLPDLIRILESKDRSQVGWIFSILEILGSRAQAAVPEVSTWLDDAVLGLAAANTLASLDPNQEHADRALRVAHSWPAEYDGERALRVARIAARLGPKAAAAVPELTGYVSAEYLIFNPFKNYKHWNLTSASITALGSIGPAASAAVPNLIGALVAEVGSAFDALVLIGPAAAPHLLPMFDHPNSQMRMNSIWICALIQPDSTAYVSALRAALNDVEPVVRWFAAWALKCAGPKAQSTAAALHALSTRDTDSEVRAIAAEAHAVVTRN